MLCSARRERAERMVTGFLLGLALGLLAPQVARLEAQEVSARVGTAVITRASGGSVKVGSGNRSMGGRSTLKLDWVMIADSTLGLVFDAPVGVVGSAAVSSWYRLDAELRLRALTSVTAFEVRILTFNVWREHTGTLSFTQLEDLEPQQRKSFEKSWGMYPEDMIREHQVSIAYVARVRLADGSVIEMDTEPVLEAARAIQGNVTRRNLEPTPEPLPALSIG